MRPKPVLRREHSVLLKMSILSRIVRQEVPNSSLTKDGNKLTYTGYPLPDLYLQNTCKFAVKSALVRRPITRRLLYSCRVKVFKLVLLLEVTLLLSPVLWLVFGSVVL